MRGRIPEHDRHSDTGKLAARRGIEDRYRSLVDRAACGIYWVSLDDRLLYANPALARMLGYDSAQDLLGVGNSQEFYCDSHARQKFHADGLHSERIRTTVEWKRRDGKTFTVRLNGQRASEPDWGSEYVEVLVEDVSERIELEKQLFQAQKFEAIGQLAGGIAHDFNNMIGAIIGWADMGIEETESGSRLRRNFEKVRQQADRAAALTRQLLAFARRQILEPRNVDLNQTAIETLGMLEKLIGTHIEIRANLSPELAIVRADPIQAEQVLMNLCINARDAMPERGSLIVETANVTLDAEFCALQPLAQPGDYVMLSISDTGTGMDSATLDRIFEPFFTTKELGKGTGLGLATVYGIVRQHGGFVHVYSEPGMGSTFRAYFPATSETCAPAVSVEESRPVQGGTETVLVAEDHDGLRQLALETLTKLGYHVVLAADGEQAVREFQAHRDRIALVILDVVLPKLSGPEVYARISAETPDLPAIFATGHSPDVALPQQLLKLGLLILQKPYSRRELARKVREALDHQIRSEKCF